MRLQTVLLACCVLACRPTLHEVDRTEFAFGSYVRLRILAPSSSTAEKAAVDAFKEIHRLDTLWSVFLPGSEIAELNRERGGAVRPETRELVTKALRVCRESGGAFDITVLPVLAAWGFVDGEYRLADSTVLEKALAGVDYRQVRVAGDSVVPGGSTQLDLGGAAVGLAVDRAVRLLRECGIEQGLVDAGGDIRVFGDRIWRIGIQNPRGSGVLRVLRLADRAVSTSGDYQRFFEHEGRRYHHLMDPRTGHPADRCVSVSVLAATALEADAYSTAAFVLGPDSAQGMFELHADYGAVYFVQESDSLREVVLGRIE